MTDLSHHVPLTFSEGLAAVRRAALAPDDLPIRVVVGAVRRSGLMGPSRTMVDSWDIPSATGPAVGELADVITAGLRGTVPASLAGPVAARYGPSGVVAAVAISSVVVTESWEHPVYGAASGLGFGSGRQLGTDMLGLAQQLYRSFAVIPRRWRALALQPRTVARWWDTHEGAMTPGALTGEEKWASMAGLAEVLGDSDLSRLYGGFLVRQGWDPLDVQAAMYGRLTRMRPGLAAAQRGVNQLVLGGLDRRRAELAGADLPAVAVEELVDLARLARSLVTVGALA